MVSIDLLLTLDVSRSDQSQSELPRRGRHREAMLCVSKPKAFCYAGPLEDGMCTVLVDKHSREGRGFRVRPAPSANYILLPNFSGFKYIKSYLLWGVKSVSITYFGLFGSPGKSRNDIGPVSCLTSWPGTLQFDFGAPGLQRYAK